MIRDILCRGAHTTVVSDSTEVLLLLMFFGRVCILARIGSRTEEVICRAQFPYIFIIIVFVGFVFVFFLLFFFTSRVRTMVVGGDR